MAHTNPCSCVTKDWQISSKIYHIWVLLQICFSFIVLSEGFLLLATGGRHFWYSHPPQTEAFNIPRLNHLSQKLSIVQQKCYFTGLPSPYRDVFRGGGIGAMAPPPLEEHKRIWMSYWYENLMICQIRYSLLYKHVTNMCSLQSMHCWTFQTSFLYRLLLQNVLSKQFDC